jgi:CDP-glucose 4,6-dehydratase
VLEPLSGYLWLGKLLEKDRAYCTAWNIGPANWRVLTVKEVVSGIIKKWSADTPLVIQRDDSHCEALLLRLDCSKASHYLKWHSTWEADQALDAIVAWYKRFYSCPGEDMYQFSVQQIREYIASAQKQQLAWACPPLGSNL